MVFDDGPRRGLRSAFVQRVRRRRPTWHTATAAMTDQTFTAQGRSSAEPDAAVELTRDEWLLLRILDETPGPVGSRLATRALHDYGATVSEATTSRLFRRLDELGLSTAQGRKGRTVTDTGRAQVRRMKRNSERNE